MPRASDQDEADELYQNNSVSWLACGALSLLANAWSILSLASRGGSGQRPRPLELLLCLLAGTHLLMAAVPLSLFSVVQLRRRHSPGYEWNEGLCKVFVSTYYTLALSTCLTVACLSYHRMWMVRWPVSYRLGGARRQALQGALGIWAASFVLSTLPSIGWHDNARRFYTRGCHFLASRIGLGFGLCFQLLLLGGVGTGLGCLGVTIYHACCCPASGNRGGSGDGGAEGMLEVPAIVVQDAQGKRRSSLDGSESPRTAAQVTGLVGGIVLLYDALTGLPILVVSFVSLRYDSAPPWMVLCVLWCSMAQTLLLPSFIWSCARYRADLRTVWEHCASMLSDSGDEDSGRDDFADGRLCEVRFDSNGAAIKRPPHYLGGDLRDGKFLPVRHVLLPTDRSQYLQVHRHQPTVVQQAVHEIQSHLSPGEDGTMRSTWILAQISHWGTEREVIAFLCDRSLLICYYDFVELGRSHVFRIPLNYIDTVIWGPLSYPKMALNKREGNAIQIKWDKFREPPSLLSWWNPWTEDLSYINLIQHPGNPEEKDLRDMCQPETFMEQLVEMVKLAHERSPLPGHANGLMVLQRPVTIDTSLGLVSLINKKVQLGYAKPRWGFGF